MVDQGASLVDQALANQEIWGYDGWKEIAPAAKEHTLHLIGLLSDGGVHSRLDQLILTIKGVSATQLLCQVCSLWHDCSIMAAQL